MSKKKKDEVKPNPIRFRDIDVIRKSIEWHLTQASDLQAKLFPHKTNRGFIIACNKEGDHVCILTIIDTHRNNFFNLLPYRK